VAGVVAGRGTGVVALLARSDRPGEVGAGHHDQGDQRDPGQREGVAELQLRVADRQDEAAGDLLAIRRRR
jgi:hypothetical protein